MVVEEGGGGVIVIQNRRYIPGKTPVCHPPTAADIQSYANGRTRWRGLHFNQGKTTSSPLSGPTAGFHFDGWRCKRAGSVNKHSEKSLTLDVYAEAAVTSLFRPLTVT